MATLKRDQSQLWAQAGTPVGGFEIGDTNNRQFAQSFTPSVTGNLDKLYLNIQKNGTPGNLIVEIFAADGSDKPTGSVLATQTISDSSVSSDTSGPPKLEIAFSSPAALTASTKYVFVLRAPSGGLFSNFYRMYGRTGGSVYSGGKLHYSLDAGSVWNDPTGDASFVTEMSTVVAQPALDQFAMGLTVGAGADRVEINTTYRAQTFTPSVTGECKQIQLGMARLDGQTGGTVTLEIRNTSAGLPGGTILATHTIPDEDILTGAGIPTITRTFASPATLIQGTVYALVLKFNNASGAARYLLNHTFTHNQYSGGQACISTDSGANWAADTSPVDLQFGVFMQEPDTTITGLRIDKFSLNADQIDLATNVTVNGPSVDDEWYAQTFAPSVTGNLKKVYICARRLSAASSGDMQLAIKATSGGVPTGADLGTANIPSTAFPDTNTEDHIQTFDFGAGVALTSGVTYAIVGRALTNGNYRWRSAATGTLFSGGQAYYSLDGGANWTSQSSEDLTFATEMDVTIAQPGIDQFGFGNTVGGANDRVENTAEYRAQTFIPKISEKLKGVKLGIRRADSQTGETMTIEIQETTGGAPNGTVIATQTFNDTAIPTAAKVITDWNFTIAPTLVAGTTYAIVIKFSNASVSRTYEIMHNDDGTGGTSGSHWKSTDSGANWVENSGPNDLLYATIMFAPTVTTQTILSDAVVQLTTEQTILSDAFHGAITTQTIPSDATIFITSEQTILSDAFHGAITTQTIFSDASVGVTQSVDIFSDAFVGQETNQTIFSDATIFVTEEEIILSDAIVFITSLQTIDSNANIFASIVQTINANASVAMTTSQTITGGAVITVREPVLKMFVVV